MGPVRIGGGRLVELGMGEGGGDINIEDEGDEEVNGLPGVLVADAGTTSG